MRTIAIDCAVLNDKKTLLKKMADIFEDMHAANYDAFIDAATFCEEKTHLIFSNWNSFENTQDLEETLQIICEENAAITFEKTF